MSDFRVYVDIEPRVQYETGFTRQMSACEILSLAHAVRDVAGIKVGDCFRRFGMESFLPKLAAITPHIFLDEKDFDTGDRLLRVSQSDAEGTVCKPKFTTIVAMAAEEGDLKKVIAATKSRVLLVTALSSWDDDYCIRTFRMPLRDVVRMNTAKAVSVGAAGITLPGTCLDAASNVHGFESLIRVVPGTRSKGVGANDQKNAVTPACAFEHGASIVVLGREVTHAPDPLAELQRVQEECARYMPLAA